MNTYDLAIFGSGFGGSLMALVGRQIGLRVVLVERGKHPRFAIGESTTPLANLVLEELARSYDLPELLPFTQWGRWQRELPDIACGLKRGFTFYFHQLGKHFQDDREHRNQLLVGANPDDSVADTHWYREEVDHALVRLVQKKGIDFLDGWEPLEMNCGTQPAELRGMRGGQEVAFRAHFLIDATGGAGGFLTRQLDLRRTLWPCLPQTCSIYSHFKGVRTLSELEEFEDLRPPPYPVDASAVHHVFPQGWIWVLRFNNGITSAGAACSHDLFKKLHSRDPKTAWTQLLAKLPSVQRQFVNAEPVRPFHFLPSLQFRVRPATGPFWALLPSASGFIDPLLSTGFPLNLLAIQRLGKLLHEHWNRPELAQRLSEWGRLSNEEQETTALLVGALYTCMDRPETFNRLALAYFTSASFCEASRRLGLFHDRDTFLLQRHPSFGPQLKSTCRSLIHRVRTAGTSLSLDVEDLHHRLDHLVVPFNIANLGRCDRKNWYPVDPLDLMEGAVKLGVDPISIETLLRKMGMGLKIEVPTY